MSDRFPDHELSRIAGELFDEWTCNGAPLLGARLEIIARMQGLARPQSDARVREALLDYGEAICEELDSDGSGAQRERERFCLDLTGLLLATFPYELRDTGWKAVGRTPEGMRELVRWIADEEAAGRTPISADPQVSLHGRWQPTLSSGRAITRGGPRIDRSFGFRLPDGWSLGDAFAEVGDGFEHLTAATVTGSGLHLRGVAADARIWILVLRDGVGAAAAVDLAGSLSLVDLRARLQAAFGEPGGRWVLVRVPEI